MASVAVLSRSSLVNSAVCSHADFVSQKSPQRVPGCASLVGKRLPVKRELSVRERRVSTLRAKAKVEAETAVPAEKAKKEAETAAPAEKAKAETAAPAEKAKAETAVPAEKAKVEAEIAVPAESASDDSVVPEVANLKEEADTAGVAPKKRVGFTLSQGGTLKGAAAAGKAPADATLGKAPALTAMGKFQDPRWKDGNWDLAQFTVDGKTDWDAVIDAEVVRRSWLERTPEASTNEDPVFFDTGVIPWWAWVKRFHLPEAEKLNGRAAMVGYAAGWLVDAASGVGLVDQQGSFFGKLLLLLTVIGVLVVRKNEDLTNLKELANEWTFYDKQWQATWKDGPPPTGKEQSEEKKW